jgi:hypothetical protein
VKGEREDFSYGSWYPESDPELIRPHELQGNDLTDVGLISSQTFIRYSVKGSKKLSAEMMLILLVLSVFGQFDKCEMLE